MERIRGELVLHRYCCGKQQFFIIDVTAEQRWEPGKFALGIEFPQGCVTLAVFSSLSHRQHTFLCIFDLLLRTSSDVNRFQHVGISNKTFQYSVSWLAAVFAKNTLASLCFVRNSCSESSMRLNYQSLGPTAEGRGEETANSKLDLFAGCRYRWQ